MSFKLPDFLNWAMFNSLRNEMKAPLAQSFVPDMGYVPIDIPVVERLKNVGIDIKLDEIQVHSDETLTYKGYRVLLYIRDVNSVGRQGNMPRYHLAYCQTLETAQKDNRFDRYVVANSDSGKFLVNVVDSEVRNQYVELNVCQNCLGKIRWEGFDKWKMPKPVRDKVVSHFSLIEFFNAYPRDLLSVKPAHTSATAPINDYSHDWETISKEIRIMRGHKCNVCHVTLKGNDSLYLHVHHRNGLKYDNREGNLEVLCIFCHARQPRHDHMKLLPQYKDFIRKYPRHEK